MTVPGGGPAQFGRYICTPAPLAGRTLGGGLLDACTNTRHCGGPRSPGTRALMARIPTSPAKSGEVPERTVQAWRPFGHPQNHLR